MFVTAKGYAVWDAGNGIVDCNYEAHIVLGSADGIRENDVLKQLLTRNPYVSKDTIHDRWYRLVRVRLNVYIHITRYVRSW